MPSHNTPQDATCSSAPQESTSAYLIRLTYDFVNAINNHDFDKAASYGYLFDHSCFSARIMEFPLARSFEEHINIYRQMAAMAPNSKIGIIDVTTNIDEVKGFADVYVYGEVENGWSIRGVSLLQWVRKGGVWLCFKHEIMKGLEDIV